MCLDEPSGDGQSKSCPGTTINLWAGTRPLAAKRAVEDAWQVIHWDAFPGIGNFDLDRTAPGRRP